MNDVTLGYRVPDVPGICWTCDRAEGDMGEVLVFPREIQEMLSAEEGRFDSPHFDSLGRVISSRSVPVREFFANGICMQCKNGWIDRVDSEFVAAYRRVAAGKLDAPDQATLAWWFARTAVLLNTSTNYRVLVPAAERWALNDGPPASFNVHLGQMPNQTEPLMFAQGAPMTYAGTMSGAELKSSAERVFVCSIRVGDLVGSVSYAPSGVLVQRDELTEIFPTPSGTIVTTDLPVLPSLTEGIVLANARGGPADEPSGKGGGVSNETRAAREELLRLAREYADGHIEEFDPKDPELSWGNALCEVLGGPDYHKFDLTEIDGGVILAVPEFGDFVSVDQFTEDQLARLEAVTQEIKAAALDALGYEYDPGSEAFVIACAFARVIPASKTSAPSPEHESSQSLLNSLLLTSLWLLNVEGGLLDLTGTRRPW
jgi:hypothetical protein